MAKYTINDTTLTSIADAIRAKGGTTAALTPAQMAKAIAAIQAGGGGGAHAEVIATGTITPSEDVDNIKKGTASNDTPLEIVHNCGKIPKAMLIYCVSGTLSSIYLYCYVEIYRGLKEGDSYIRSDIILIRKASTNYSCSVSTNSASIDDFEWTDNVAFLGHENTTTRLRAGCSYEWFAYA